MIALSQNDLITYDRLEQLRYDPVDNRFYNIQHYKPQPHVEARLIHRVEHSAPILKIRLEEYNNFLACVEKDYQRQLVRVNAEESPEIVFANLCETVEKPVAW